MTYSSEYDELAMHVHEDIERRSEGGTIIGLQYEYRCLLGNVREVMEG